MMQKSWIGRAIAVLTITLIVLIGSRAVAQVATATINGTVVDTTGAVVPGAAIAVTQIDTNYTVKTVSGKTGEYLLPNLPIGPYKLQVKTKGFAQYEQTGLVLTVGQVATVQIALQVGSEAEQVVVTAEAPAVEATESTIQNVVEEKVVSDLPLNGRNPAALVNTVAGVTDATMNITSATSNISAVKAGDSGMPSASAPTTHGVRPGGTYFSLDGAGNVDPYVVVGAPFPNPDATQEFSVVTGSYGARYVSAPGGAINVVTKSGTNQFHGSVFEFIRNGYFNARNALSTQADVLKRNQYGFAVGGPIVKDKAFFFVSYQGSPISNSAASKVATPTTDQRNGIFTYTDSNSNVQTMQIPSYFKSATIQNLFKYIPLPDSTGYVSLNKPEKTNEPQYVVKLDWNAGSHRVFARYFGDLAHTQVQAMRDNNIFGTSAGSRHYWNSFAVGDTWASKTGAWVADSRVAFSKASASNFFGDSSDVSLASLGATNFSASKTDPGLGVIVTNFVASSPGFNEFPRQTLDLSEDILHTAGKHQISIGADYRQISYKENNVSGQNGVAIFVGVASKILFGSLGTLSNATYMDFYMGRPIQWIQSDGFFDSAKGNMIGLYGEDKYRVSERLTATLGLRWDPFLPFAPDNKRIDCWNPGQLSTVYTNAPKGLIYPGDSGCSNGGTDAKYNNFQPRLGLAYKVDKKGNTALRAGYGIYATQMSLRAFTGFAALPWVRKYTISNPFQSIDDIWTSNGMTDPFTAGFHGASYTPSSDVAYPTSSAGFTVGALDKNFRPAYVQQYTISLQQALSSKDSVEMAYVGTGGVHIANSYDVNLPATSSTASTSNELSRRPYGAENLASIIVLRSDTTSNYNGLDVTYRHHAKNFGVNSSFNWSRCMDEGSAPPTTAAISENGASRKLMYGRCDYDQNLAFRNTLTYTTPSLKNVSKKLNMVAGEWMTSGLIVLDAGQPFSVLDSSDNSYTGIGLDRADYSAEYKAKRVPLYKNGHLNRAAFADNAGGTYGNTPRNGFRAPKYTNFDIALMKDFKVGSFLTTTFRAESFNVFNHANFLPPTNTYNTSTDATFGYSTTARDPRIMQFSLKLAF